MKSETRNPEIQKHIIFVLKYIFLSVMYVFNRKAFAENSFDRVFAFKIYTIFASISQS